LPYKNYLLYLIVITAIVFNFNHFKPWDHVDITTNEKLSGEFFEEQQKGAVMDYLPITATKPVELAPNKPWFIKGSGVITDYKTSSDSFNLVLVVNEKAELAIPIFDFSYWAVYVDDKPVEHSITEEGVISISMKEGTHTISASFENTNIRKISNTITIVSIMAFVIFIVYEKNRNIRKK